MNRPPGPTRWYGTLAFRIAVVLVVALFVFESLRRLLDTLLPQRPGDDLLPSLAAFIVAGSLAYLVSARLLRPLARLAGTAAESDGNAGQPRHPSDLGKGEIATVAKTMKRLRDRVEEQSKTLALRDIRRSEWIAQVSHDLRTPLTAQAACLDRLDLILQNPATELNRDDLRELLSVARMDGGRVHTLADDLLEIARLEAGDRLLLEPVPPGELVSQAVMQLTPLAQQRGIQLDVNVTTHLPVLNADGRRLMRAIENLVRNAIQHAKLTVEVTAARSEDGVRFEVRDDGPGLPKQPDFLSYLRRRGGEVRLSELAGRGSRPDSAGLGLVVAQRVAEAHGGSIDAYNVSRGGAAFSLDIPLKS